MQIPRLSRRSASFVQQQRFNDFFAEEKRRMKDVNGDLVSLTGRKGKAHLPRRLGLERD